MFTAFLSSLVFLSSFALIFSYNVDTDYPIVHVDPEAGESNYFGYSVALRSRGNGAPYSSLFVGAPRSSEGNGTVYRCPLIPIGNPSNSSCQKLTIAPALTYVRVADSLRSIDVYRVGNNGWLGASMATGEFSDLTVCAPHSQITFRDANRPKDRFVHDMRGLCYDLPNGLGDILHRDNAILKSYEFPLTVKINAVYGFSVNYPVRKVPNMVERIIGKPRINAVEIAHKNAKEERSQDPRKMSYLGYSLASGYFFEHDQILFVAGAPVALHKGMVVVYEPASDNQTIIPGSVFGEYFGGSLAAGDFDGDGLDEIAVGAPHWGEVDYGRVYIFTANNERSDFKEGLMLQGTVHHAMFGYTLTAGDLDSDGFSDLVVSAPWEGKSGIVYVFYGNRGFGIKGSSTPVSQRIEPSKFANPLSVERFGFALSPPVDVDENGYPDLAIGAFKSGQTVLLRSKPVIDTKISLTSDPATLEKSTRSFRVSICVVYSGRKAPSRQELKLHVTINEINRRVESELSKIFKVLLTREQQFCTNLTVQLKNGITNYVDPIVISVKHDTVDSGLSGNKFCPTCAVLSKRSATEHYELTVPFNTGCRNGTVCNSHLSIGWAFENVRNDDEWIVGSGDVDLNLLIRNQGEPAYLTQIRIQFPPGTKLRKIVPSCVDSQDNDIIVMLICDIGNPLVEGEDKALNIGIDMGQLSESAGGTILYFVVSITTRSVDLGPNPVQFIVLKLKNEAFVRLTGITFGVRQDFGRTGNKTKVSFRHAYRVRKFGATPVREALMAIDVPVAMTAENISFVDIRIPELNSYGQIYQCSIIETKEARLKLLSEFVDPVKPRLLRSVSEDILESDQQFEEVTEETTTETNSETIDNQRENGTLAEQSGSGQIPMKIIYINCSMDSIICVAVVCRFSLLKTSEDMGNLLLDMTLDAAVFNEANDDVSASIKFSTNATVQIISPVLKPENDTHRAYANASTMLYNVSEQQPLAGWILPASIGVGVLLFIILAVVLLKVGFFRRPNLEETARARETELILQAQEEDEQDPFG